VIAEATKSTGALMAAQMQTIAEASRDLERSKIEVQLKLFSEQMQYQREKDRRMYEHASIANENARLAILKQGEIVNCLAQLSSVLGQGLTMSNTHGIPPEAEPVHTSMVDPRATATSADPNGSPKTTDLNGTAETAKPGATATKSYTTPQEQTLGIQQGTVTPSANMATNP